MGWERFPPLPAGQVRKDALAALPIQKFAPLDSSPADPIRESPRRCFPAHAFEIQTSKPSFADGNGENTARSLEQSALATTRLGQTSSPLRQRYPLPPKPTRFGNRNRQAVYL